MSVTEMEGPKTPLKILMTADAVGGVWQYCVDLVSGLARGGVELMVATMGPRPSTEQRRQLKSIPGVSIAESDFALEWMTEPWADVDAAGAWLMQLAAEFKPDIVHLNGYSHAALPWTVPVVVVAHSCVFTWWKGVHGCPPTGEWQAYQERVAAGLQASSRIIAPTAAVGTDVCEEYGVKAERMRVIPNFSRSQRFERGTKFEFCLAAGRFWDPAKNMALLDRVATQLEWPVRIAGQSQSPENAGFTPRNLKMLGALPHRDLIAYMHAAAVFVHPALYEPFGLAVLEAARSRCCLVLSDIPSLRELWDGAAVFVDPHDEERWVTEITSVCSDPIKRERFAARAYTRSAQYCALSSINQYIDAYSELAPHAVLKRKGVAA